MSKYKFKLYRLAEQGESDWRTIRVNKDGATTFTLYNLQSDTEYDFQVLSRNILGDGWASPIVRAKTKGPLFPCRSPRQTPNLSAQLGITSAACTRLTPTERPTSPQFRNPRCRVSGPKPWPPRNVTVNKTPQGLHIQWMPPLNRSVPIAFYYVEYRTGDQAWQRGEPVKDHTSYLGTSRALRCSLIYISGGGVLSMEQNRSVRAP
ncbi:IGSF9B [Cordylochernes scorpioides]|uniref:IGSF9B n=1 Tax=Cordylochernes scorpioides TaxID=51811 RepID=A0ABY6LVF8_9ARAC|nr:IGSF9B [Cordylochernes scorpioides]